MNMDDCYLTFKEGDPLLDIVQEDDGDAWALVPYSTSPNRAVRVHCDLVVGCLRRWASQVQEGGWSFSISLGGGEVKVLQQRRRSYRSPVPFTHRPNPLDEAKAVCRAAKFILGVIRDHAPAVVHEWTPTPVVPVRSKVCTDPDKMHGACDDFGGSDYD